MTGILLSALFTFGGSFALASLVGSWKRHGAAFRALHRELRACGATRDFTVTTLAVKVHAQAVVLRPAFRAPDRSPEPTAALPAAA